MAVPDHYRFGPYEIRTRTRELYKYGTKLKLRPQPFQVLRVLVEHAGEVVTREELRKMLWPAETFVDFEHGLNTSIKELRQILSDSAAVTSTAPDLQMELAKWTRRVSAQLDTVRKYAFGDAFRPGVIPAQPVEKRKSRARAPQAVAA